MWERHEVVLLSTSAVCKQTTCCLMTPAVGTKSFIFMFRIWRNRARLGLSTYVLVCFSQTSQMSVTKNVHPFGGGGGRGVCVFPPPGKRSRQLWPVGSEREAGLPGRAPSGWRGVERKARRRGGGGAGQGMPGQPGPLSRSPDLLATESRHEAEAPPGEAVSSPWEFQKQGRP